MRHRWRAMAIASVFALLLGGCQPAGDAGPEEAGRNGPDGPAVDEEPELPDEILTGHGITEAPCPEATNPDNGCIYLGTLTDITAGPFAMLGAEAVAGQRAFWQRVNDEGGIAGFDVDVDTYLGDSRYDPADHLEIYGRISPNVLALGQTLGTVTTRAILPELAEDDMVAVPLSSWSGWDFPAVDGGLVLGSGASYCLQAQVGLDHLDAEEAAAGSVVVVGYANEFGGDYAADVDAGVRAWAAANDADVTELIETTPNSVSGSQDEAIARLVEAEADVVVLAVGPAETADIVAGADAQGFAGGFLGMAPSWHPSLLDAPAGAVLRERYVQVSPWEGIQGESAAHDAIRAALDGELPSNDGFVAGWVASYPLLAALRAAAANGDLTRSGLRAVLDGLVVDSEGALPEAILSATPAATAPRTAVISRPSTTGPDAPLGLATVAVDAEGPTAESFDLRTPCTG